MPLDFVSASIYNNKVKILEKGTEFEWDKGNIDKNWLKHRVSNKESEESFFDKNSIIYKDVIHSKKEERFIDFVCIMMLLPILHFNSLV